MAYISEEEISNIRNQADIVSVINEYVPLSKKGNNYVGICPFHEDHSPSMCVNPNLKIFKCFVCGAGGNIFSFVKSFENVSYPKAIEIVAKKSNIDFKIDIKDENESKFKEEYAIMDLSLKYYQNNLATQNGIEAKKYLLSRGIDDNIIKEFKIGLSSLDNSLTAFLKTKNVNLNKASEIGLLNQNGIDYYDTFVNRIMIPIFDMNGNLAGYTARAYVKDEKNKYINSKETAIYKKGNILFNYYKAKESARLNRKLIIVEGNMDVISLAHSGITNVIALMGVVMSKMQIDYIKKLNAKVILMLDSDNAGTTATIKVGDELIKYIPETYVVRLSGAKDPDEYIRKYGVESLNDNINHAYKYIDFKIEYLKEGKDLEKPSQLSSYINDVINSISSLPKLDQDIILSKICNNYGINPSILMSNISKEEKPKSMPKEIKVKKKSRYKLAVQELIYAMLLNKDYYMIYMNNLGYLLEKIERDTVNVIGSYIKHHNNIDVAGFIDETLKYDDISEYVNEILMSNNAEKVYEKDFYDILAVVSFEIKQDEINKLKIAIKNEMDISKKIELMERLTKLKKGDKDARN